MARVGNLERRLADNLEKAGIGGLEIKMIDKKVIRKLEKRFHCELEMSEDTEKQFLKWAKDWKIPVEAILIIVLKQHRKNEEE